jgi:hypothetical protein
MDCFIAFAPRNDGTQKSPPSVTTAGFEGCA